MAGTTIPLITMREYDFASSGDVVVVKAVPVQNWTSGTLQVRVHSTTVTSSSTLDVKAYTTAPTNEDPTKDFVADSAAVTAQIDSSTTAPGLVLGSLSANFGAFLRLVVEGTVSGGTCKATISADLVLKD